METANIFIVIDHQDAAGGIAAAAWLPVARFPT
jgi:hypothetical protein